MERKMPAPEWTAEVDGATVEGWDTLMPHITRMKVTRPDRATFYVDVDSYLRPHHGARREWLLHHVKVALAGAHAGPMRYEGSNREEESEPS